jgi:hypothetical protein
MHLPEHTEILGLMGKNEELEGKRCTFLHHGGLFKAPLKTCYAYAWILPRVEQLRNAKFLYCNRRNCGSVTDSAASLSENLAVD